VVGQREQQTHTKRLVKWARWVRTFQISACAWIFLSKQVTLAALAIDQATQPFQWVPAFTLLVGMFLVRFSEDRVLDRFAVGGGKKLWKRYLFQKERWQLVTLLLWVAMTVLILCSHRTHALSTSVLLGSAEQPMNRFTSFCCGTALVMLFRRMEGSPHGFLTASARCTPPIGRNAARC